MSIKKFIKSNLVAIVAVFLAIGTMSFKALYKKGDSEKRTGTYWYYVSPLKTGFSDTTRWSLSNNSESCVLDGERPCKVLVEEGKTLSNVIENQSDADIIQMSEGTKKTNP